jgi:hypothetical protein
VFRAQAIWTFILPSELPAKELRHLPRKMPPRLIRLLSTWCRAAAFFSSTIHGVHCAGLSDFSVRGAARRHFSCPLYTVFIVQAYQTSQYMVPRGGIFLGKWRSSFAGSSDVSNQPAL